MRYIPDIHMLTGISINVAYQLIRYVMATMSFFKDLTKFFAKFHIFPKLCMHVGKDYTNEFPKFQVHRPC